MNADDENLWRRWQMDDPLIHAANMRLANCPEPQRRAVIEAIGEYLRLRAMFVEQAQVQLEAIRRGAP